VPGGRTAVKVAELYAAYQKVGLTLEEFEGPRYKRIAHIQKLMDEHHLDTTLRWKTPEMTASLAY